MLDIIFGFAGVVSLLMVAIIVAAYMGSKALNLPNLEVFAKIELYELFISILILIFAIGFSEFSNFIADTLFDFEGTRFEEAREFHSQVMLEGVYPAVSYCYKMIWLFSTLNMMQLRPNDSVWTWIYKVCPGSDSIVGIFNLLSYGLIILMATLNTHFYILSFIEATMFYFFLPAGILLRFFPATRKAGVFVITLAIGFYVIYPTVFALNFQILDRVAQLETGDPNAHYEFFDAAAANAVFTRTFATPFIISGIVSGESKLVDILSRFFPGGPTIKAMLNTFTGFMASESFAMIVQPFLFADVIRSIAALSLVTFFIPALALVVTIAFINGVTNFIDRKVGS